MLTMVVQYGFLQAVCLTCNRTIGIKALNGTKRLTSDLASLSSSTTGLLTEGAFLPSCRLSDTSTLNRIWLC